jgi:hypothetical protein
MKESSDEGRGSGMAGIHFREERGERGGDRERWHASI